MGLPAGRAGQPILESTPTQGATMEYGGNPFNPNQPSMKQPSPFAELPLTPSPETLPLFTQTETQSLQNQFMKTNFPNGMPPKVNSGGGYPWQ